MWGDERLVPSDTHQWWTAEIRSCGKKTQARRELNHRSMQYQLKHYKLSIWVQSVCTSRHLAPRHLCTSPPLHLASLYYNCVTIYSLKSASDLRSACSGDYRSASIASTSSQTVFLVQKKNNRPSFDRRLGDLTTRLFRHKLAPTKHFFSAYLKCFRCCI